jgi:twitching motility two-component system response regulator PilG
MAKIVFCEDDDILRKLIGIILRDSPHAIYFASDGLAGLALIERERPALVFTDQYMEKLDGFELCAALKAQAHLAQIPIVLMSGAILNEAQTAQFPFVARLVKPFSQTTLRALIDDLLGDAGQPP